MQAEVNWAKATAKMLNARLVGFDKRLSVVASFRLAYMNEVLHNDPRIVAAFLEMIGPGG
jgi:hypothetical protein